MHVARDSQSSCMERERKRKREEEVERREGDIPYILSKRLAQTFLFRASLGNVGLMGGGGELTDKGNGNPTPHPARGKDMVAKRKK